MILKNQQSISLFSFAAVAMALVLFQAGAAEPSNQLQKPDGKAVDMTKPLQVFILMGQSNMVGLGKIDPFVKTRPLE